MQLADWQSKTNDYQKSLEGVLEFLKRPISLIKPTFFFEKINDMKQELKLHGTIDDEVYLDVLLYSIEGNVNKSLNQLAMELMQEYGSTIRFWRKKILDMADNQLIDTECRIWHINREMLPNFGELTTQVSSLRKFRRMAKQYIITLRKLIRTIQKAQNEQDIDKIEPVYQKYQLISQKYQQSIKDNHIPIKPIKKRGNTHLQQPTLTHFFHKKESQKENETEKYKYKERQSLNNVFQPNKQLIQGEDDMLIKAINEENAVSVDKLREQFLSTKQKIERKEWMFINIWDKEYYFVWLNHRVQCRKYVYTEPFARKEGIQYDIDSEEEYDELLAENISSNGEISNASEYSKNSILVSDHYYSDGELSQQDCIMPHRNLEQSCWSFNRQDKDIDQNRKIWTIVPLQESVPIKLQESVEEVSLQQINVMIEGKTRKQLYTKLQGEGIQYQKQHIENHLKTNFNKKRVQNKTVYTSKAKSGQEEELTQESLPAT